MPRRLGIALRFGVDVVERNGYAGPSPAPRAAVRGYRSPYGGSWQSNSVSQQTRFGGSQPNATCVYPPTAETRSLILNLGRRMYAHPASDVMAEAWVIALSIDPFERRMRRQA
jgi:hypothetical protein